VANAEQWVLFIEKMRGFSVAVPSWLSFSRSGNMRIVSSLLFCGLVLCGCQSNRLYYLEDGPDTAKTVQEIKESVALDSEWKETEFAKRKFLFALTFEGDGESYIDLHGWIYNRHFKEWRRILTVKTRNVGNAELFIDDQKGVLSLRGASNNDLKGVEVFRFDLRATSNDSAYEN
jgi:hypothetical protein